MRWRILKIFFYSCSMILTWMFSRPDDAGQSKLKLSEVVEIKSFLKCIIK